jgi:hypothetical protein
MHTSLARKRRRATISKTCSSFNATAQVLEVLARHLERALERRAQDREHRVRRTDQHGMPNR